MEPLNDSVRVPRDPEARRRLADFAGLTDEERAALDQWCYEQEAEQRQGILRCDAEKRGR